MLIDWFTVAAQIVNFLVLVWLLKRYAYKPILNAIDAREKRIAAERDGATAANATAQKAAEALGKKTLAFDAERDDLMATAVSASNAERERLLVSAQKETQALRTAQAAEVADERTKLQDQLMRLVGTEVYEAARRLLTDLADVNLEEKVMETFIGRLGRLDAASKESFRASLAQSPRAIVRSRFDVPLAAKDNLRRAMNEAFSASVQLEFITSPAMICGIEVTANGQKASWSVAEYLASLQHDVAALLDAATATQHAGSAPLSPLPPSPPLAASPLLPPSSASTLVPAKDGSSSAQSAKRPAAAVEAAAAYDDAARAAAST